jgi:hypothetical protein
MNLVRRGKILLLWFVLPGDDINICSIVPGNYEVRRQYKPVVDYK